jgi:hypothetical protein
MGKKFKVATIYANCAINVLYGVGHCRRESPEIAVLMRRLVM